MQQRQRSTGTRLSQWAERLVSAWLHRWDKTCPAVRDRSGTCHQLRRRLCAARDDVLDSPALAAEVVVVMIMKAHAKLNDSGVGS